MTRKDNESILLVESQTDSPNRRPCYELSLASISVLIPISLIVLGATYGHNEVTMGIITSIKACKCQGNESFHRIKVSFDYLESYNSTAVSPVLEDMTEQEWLLTFTPDNITIPRLYYLLQTPQYCSVDGPYFSDTSSMAITLGSVLLLIVCLLIMLIAD